MKQYCTLKNAHWCTCLLLILSKILKRRKMFWIYIIFLKKTHFFSGFYTIWEEIRHSNTHKDMDTYNCVQHNVKKKQQLFSSVFIGQLKIKFSVGSMLDRSEQQIAKTAQLQAENFLQTRDCTRGNFVFYCKSGGFAFSRLLLLISICN